MAAASRILLLFALFVAAIRPGTTAEDVGRVDVYGDPLPKGAVARLGTVRFRTTEGIHAATYSADERFVIGITNEAICYWDAGDGRLQAKVPNEEESNIQQVAISADRRRAAASDFLFDKENRDHRYTLKLWDLEKREVIKAIELDRESNVSSLAISGDGAFVAAGNEMGRVRIYDVELGVEILAYDVLEGLTSIALSPDGKQLLAAGRDKKLLGWQWESGEEPQTLRELEGEIESCTFSPDGKLVAVGVRGRLHALSTEDWSVARTFDGFHKYSSYSGMAFSPDGSKLAASLYDRESVFLWDLASGEVLRTWPLRPERAVRLVFSGDGTWLVGVSAWNASPPRFFNVETGEQHEVATQGHHQAPSHIEFLSVGKSVVTAGDDGTIRFWEAETGRQLRMASHHPTEPPEGQHNTWIRAMGDSDDGRFIATSSLDDTVRLWDAATATEIFSLAGHGRLGGNRAVEFTPDGRRLASWGDDMFLRIWDTETGKALAEHAIQPGGVATGEGDGSERAARARGMRYGITHPRFSRDASLLVLGLEPTFYVFDVDSGKELGKFEAAEGRMFRFDIAPDGKRLLSGGMGKPTETRLADGRTRHGPADEYTVQLRSLPQGEVVYSKTMKGTVSGPVVFNHDGSLFAAGTWSGREPIRVYKTESGDEVAQITGFDGQPRALAFSQDNAFLAASLTDTTVLIWDWKSFAEDADDAEDSAQPRKE